MTPLSNALSQGTVDYELGYQDNEESPPIEVLANSSLSSVEVERQNSHEKNCKRAIYCFLALAIVGVIVILAIAINKEPSQKSGYVPIP